MLKRKLFLDCDGVLANFDKRAVKIFGMEPSQFEEEFGSKKFWEVLKSDVDFFLNLELMPDARHLWDWCQMYDPTILTGCPRGNWAQPQKIAWAKLHFNTDKIITCASKDKKLHGQPGDILVDDTLKYKHLWEEMGGIFVHHKDACKTIEELSEIMYWQFLITGP